MKEFKIIDSKTGTESLLNLPTKVDEITVDWLLDVTKNVIPAPNYSLVALISKDTMANLLNTTKRKEGNVVGVIPVFIKHNEDECSSFVKNISCKTALVISGSDLSMGHHINAPKNNISPMRVFNKCKVDNNAYREALKDLTPIYLVEFKVIYDSAIHGVILDETENK